MEINTSNLEFYFSLFYVLSFAVPFVLFIVFSSRLKIPLWSILLMLTTVSLCTIIGSRLTSIPISEWGQIISSGRFEGHESRYAVGGLLFGLAGLIFSLRVLGLGKPVINLYAWIAPIGFGVQKIGCLLNGCCYGNPSELPWSIQYTLGSNAHYHQWISGIIDDKAALSISLHPVQLYEVIALFTIAFIVWRSQKFLMKTGSTMIFSLFLFFIFRFFIGFLRDPSGSNFSSTLISGITMVQWFFLIIGVFCGIILLLYEKRLKPIVQNHTNADTSIKTSLLYILTSAAAIYVFRSLFTPFELLSLDMTFIPAIFLTSYHVYKALTRVRLRLAATSFFVLPLFLIIQTSSPDSTKFGALKDFYQNEVKSYKRVDFGTSLGVYNTSVVYNPHEEECGTSYTTEDYSYIYRIFGAGYSSVIKKERVIATSGINLYGGTINENNLTISWQKRNFLFGINPYIKYDFKWVGIGAGAHLGNLRWVPEEQPIDKVIFDRGTRFSPVLPEGYIRFGRRDILNLKFNYGFNNPTPFPVAFKEYSIGSGFGNKSEFELRIGNAVSSLDSYAFISAEGLLTKQVGFTFKFNFGNGSFDYQSINKVEDRMGRFHLGLNYRFGFEK